MSGSAETVCPLVRHLSALAAVAEGASDHEIAAVVGAASRQRNDVVDVVAAADFLAAPVAETLLPVVLVQDVGGRVVAGSASTAVRLGADDLRVGLAPSAFDGSHAIGVCDTTGSRSCGPLLTVRRIPRRPLLTARPWVRGALLGDLLRSTAFAVGRDAARAIYALREVLGRRRQNAAAPGALLSFPCLHIRSIAQDGVG